NRNNLSVWPHLRKSLPRDLHARRKSLRKTSRHRHLLPLAHLNSLSGDLLTRNLLPRILLRLKLIELLLPRKPLRADRTRCAAWPRWRQRDRRPIPRIIRIDILGKSVHSVRRDQRTIAWPLAHRCVYLRRPIRTRRSRRAAHPQYSERSAGP